MSDASAPANAACAWRSVHLDEHRSLLHRVAFVEPDRP